MRRKGYHAYGFHREVKTRAKHGLRGFMPRNRVTPYECRRHEVRGGGHPPDTGVWKTRKGCKFPFFKRLYTLFTIPRTSPLACARRLVRGYLFALLAELRPVLRTSFYVSFCTSVLKNYSGVARAGATPLWVCDRMYLGRLFAKLAIAYALRLDIAQAATFVLFVLGVCTLEEEHL